MSKTPNLRERQKFIMSLQSFDFPQFKIVHVPKWYILGTACSEPLHWKDK